MTMPSRRSITRVSAVRVATAVVVVIGLGLGLVVLNVEAAAFGGALTPPHSRSSSSSGSNNAAASPRVSLRVVSPFNSHKDADAVIHNSAARKSTTRTALSNSRGRGGDRTTETMNATSASATSTSATSVVSTSTSTSTSTWSAKQRLLHNFNPKKAILQIKQKNNGNHPHKTKNIGRTLVMECSDIESDSDKINGTGTGTRSVSASASASASDALLLEDLEESEALLHAAISEGRQMITKMEMERAANHHSEKNKLRSVTSTALFAQKDAGSGTSSGTSCGAGTSNGAVRPQKARSVIKRIHGRLRPASSTSSKGPILRKPTESTDNDTDIRNDESAKEKSRVKVTAKAAASESISESVSASVDKVPNKLVPDTTTEDPVLVHDTPDTTDTAASNGSIDAGDIDSTADTGTTNNVKSIKLTPDSDTNDPDAISYRPNTITETSAVDASDASPRKQDSGENVASNNNVAKDGKGDDEAATKDNKEASAFSFFAKSKEATKTLTNVSESESSPPFSSTTTISTNDKAVPSVPADESVKLAAGEKEAVKLKVVVGQAGKHLSESEKDNKSSPPESLLQQKKEKTTVEDVTSKTSVLQAEQRSKVTLAGSDMDKDDVEASKAQTKTKSVPKIAVEKASTSPTPPTLKKSTAFGIEEPEESTTGSKESTAKSIKLAKNEVKGNDAESSVSKQKVVVKSREASAESPSVSATISTKEPKEDVVSSKTLSKIPSDPVTFENPNHEKSVIKTEPAALLESFDGTKPVVSNEQVQERANAKVGPRIPIQHMDMESTSKSDSVADEVPKRNNADDATMSTRSVATALNNIENGNSANKRTRESKLLKSLAAKFTSVDLVNAQKKKYRANPPPKISPSCNGRNISGPRTVPRSISGLKAPSDDVYEPIARSGVPRVHASEDRVPGDASSTPKKLALAKQQPRGNLSQRRSHTSVPKISTERSDQRRPTPTRSPPPDPVVTTDRDRRRKDTRGSSGNLFDDTKPTPKAGFGSMEPSAIEEASDNDKFSAMRDQFMTKGVFGEESGGRQVATSRVSTQPYVPGEESLEPPTTANPDMPVSETSSAPPPPAFGEISSEPYQSPFDVGADVPQVVSDRQVNPQPFGMQSGLQDQEGGSFESSPPPQAPGQAAAESQAGAHDGTSTTFEYSPPLPVQQPRPKTPAELARAELMRKLVGDPQVEGDQGYKPAFDVGSSGTAKVSTRQVSSAPYSASGGSSEPVTQFDRTRKKKKYAPADPSSQPSVSLVSSGGEAQTVQSARRVPPPRSYQSGDSQQISTSQVAAPPREPTEGGGTIIISGDGAPPVRKSKKKPSALFQSSSQATTEQAAAESYQRSFDTDSNGPQQVSTRTVSTTPYHGQETVVDYNSPPDPETIAFEAAQASMEPYRPSFDAGASGAQVVSDRRVSPQPYGMPAVPETALANSTGSMASTAPLPPVMQVTSELHQSAFDAAESSVGGQMGSDRSNNLGSHRTQPGTQDSLGYDVPPLPPQHVTRQTPFDQYESPLHAESDAGQVVLERRVNPQPYRDPTAAGYDVPPSPPVVGQTSAESYHDSFVGGDESGGDQERNPQVPPPFLQTTGQVLSASYHTPIFDASSNGDEQVPKSQINYQTPSGRQDNTGLSHPNPQLDQTQSNQQYDPSRTPSVTSPSFDQDVTTEQVSKQPYNPGSIPTFGQNGSTGQLQQPLDSVDTWQSYSLQDPSEGCEAPSVSMPSHLAKRQGELGEQYPAQFDEGTNLPVNIFSSEGLDPASPSHAAAGQGFSNEISEQPHDYIASSLPSNLHSQSCVHLESSQPNFLPPQDEADFHEDITNMFCQFSSPEPRIPRVPNHVLDQPVPAMYESRHVQEPFPTSDNFCVGDDILESTATNAVGQPGSEQYSPAAQSRDYPGLENDILATNYNLHAPSAPAIDNYQVPAWIGQYGSQGETLLEGSSLSSASNYAQTAFTGQGNAFVGKENRQYPDELPLQTPVDPGTQKCVANMLTRTEPPVAPASIKTSLGRAERPNQPLRSVEPHLATQLSSQTTSTPHSPQQLNNLQNNNEIQQEINNASIKPLFAPQSSQQTTPTPPSEQQLHTLPNGNQIQQETNDASSADSFKRFATGASKVQSHSSPINQIKQKTSHALSTDFLAQFATCKSHAQSDTMKVDQIKEETNVDSFANFATNAARSQHRSPSSPVFPTRGESIPLFTSVDASSAISPQPKVTSGTNESQPQPQSSLHPAYLAAIAASSRQSVAPQEDDTLDLREDKTSTSAGTMSRKSAFGFRNTKSYLDKLGSSTSLFEASRRPNIVKMYSRGAELPFY